MKKKGKQLNPSKMARLSKDIPGEELVKHIEIIKSIAGEGYIMTPEHEKVISGMIYYFHGIQSRAQKYGFDITKGIGITGTWGVGKTTIFGAFHEYLSTICSINYNPNTFRITSFDEIAELLRSKTISEASKSIFLYNSSMGEDGIENHHPIHLCINEFGRRYDIKHYGTNINELIDIFLSLRYDIFIKYNRATHMTTNYGAKDLEKIFNYKEDDIKPDSKLPDRFREMFKIKNLKGTSFR
ncbi:MAG: hypothetical protein PHT07_15020 [Paludibacter sp.]|nr:hypothetical protein [Paludibacter sp.]